MFNFIYIPHTCVLKNLGSSNISYSAGTQDAYKLKNKLINNAKISFTLENKCAVASH